jgi:hypothetical protein
MTGASNRNGIATRLSLSPMQPLSPQHNLSGIFLGRWSALEAQIGPFPGCSTHKCFLYPLIKGIRWPLNFGNILSVPTGCPNKRLLGG